MADPRDRSPRSRAEAPSWRPSSSRTSSTLSSSCPGPMMTDGLGITSGQFGHIVAAYGFGSFFGSLLAAKFLERFGRKTVLLTVYCGFTISTLLCGLTPNYALLVACRALAGVFGGVVGVSVFAVVGDVFADYRRGTATGVVMSSFAVATIAGVPLGLGIAETFGTLTPFTPWLGWSRSGRAAVVMPAARHRSGRIVARRPGLGAESRSGVSVHDRPVPDRYGRPAHRLDGQERRPEAEYVKYVYLAAGLFTFVSMNVIGRLETSTARSSCSGSWALSCRPWRSRTCRWSGVGGGLVRRSSW